MQNFKHLPKIVGFQKDNLKLQRFWVFTEEDIKLFGFNEENFAFPLKKLWNFNVLTEETFRLYSGKFETLEFEIWRFHESKIKATYEATAGHHWNTYFTLQMHSILAMGQCMMWRRELDAKCKTRHEWIQLYCVIHTSSS